MVLVAASAELMPTDTTTAAAPTAETKQELEH
jgi:hypothetical protein